MSKVGQEKVYWEICYWLNFNLGDWKSWNSTQVNVTKRQNKSVISFDLELR